MIALESDWKLDLLVWFLIIYGVAVFVGAIYAAFWGIPRILRDMGRSIARILRPPHNK